MPGKTKKPIKLYTMPNDDHNEDWIKSMSWDLPEYDTAEQLAAGIAPMTIEHFMTLPASKPMPLKLRKQVLAYLKHRAVLSTKPPPPSS